MFIFSNRNPIVLTWIVIVTFTLGLQDAKAQWPEYSHGTSVPTLAPLIEEVTPAVVNISVTGKSASQKNPFMDDPFFQRFFNFPNQGQVVPRQSVGSGVIVDARKGYIVTNHHVVANADKITITLQDRRQFVAEMVGSDEGTDIALLRIDAKNLSALKLGDSSALRVGDFVVAIGNPFGLGQTVTSGIVSALGRSGINIEGYEDFIQTDASINPGNSGGALINLEGDLMGVNTAIIAPAGGNVGIGFAVPAHMVKSVIEQLLEYGEVRRGRLGVVIQDVTPDLSDAMGLNTTSGALITQVEPDTAAEGAGLRAGDVVTEVDGQVVTDSSALRNRIGLMRVGEKVQIGIIRDGKRKTVNAKIGKAQTATLVGERSMPKLSGAEFRNLDSSHALHGKIEGVLVAQVDQGSPAWRNGLRRGDIIMAVNRQPVKSTESLSAALQNAGPAIALNILRGNIRLFVVIQ